MNYLPLMYALERIAGMNKTDDPENTHEDAFNSGNFDDAFELGHDQGLWDGYAHVGCIAIQALKEAFGADQNKV